LLVILYSGQKIMACLLAQDVGQVPDPWWRTAWVLLIWIHCVMTFYSSVF
jgi:hypothetical protein